MIKITHVEKVNDDGEQYYAFVIHVSPSNVRLGDATTHIIPRSYREFAEFNRNWRSTYPGVKHIKLPAKRLLNTTKNLESQRQLLETYLHEMLSVSALRADLAEFLSVSPDIWGEVVRRHSVVRRKQLRPIASTATIIPPPPMEEDVGSAFGEMGMMAAPGVVETVIMSLNEWDRIKDEESGKYYYHNNETGKTTWKTPAVFKEFGEVADIRPMDELMLDDDDSGSSGALRRSFRAVTKMVGGGGVQGKTTGARTKAPAKKVGKGKASGASKTAGNSSAPAAPKRTQGAAPSVVAKLNRKSPWRAAVDIESG
jgi:hypothetical protein